MNPFKYGDPVSGEFYFSRAALKGSVTNFLQNHINVVVIGPRRYGKTSFLLDLLTTLEASGKNTLYLDVFSVTSHRDFLSQLVYAVNEKRGLAKKIWGRLRELLRAYSPAVEMKTEASAVTFGVSLKSHRLDDQQVKELIQQTLDSMDEVGGLTVVIDEFQSIGRLDDDGWLEAILRTKMQIQKNVVYAFSGSRHGIIHDMFNNPARPFYRSCQLIDFPKLGPDFTNWLAERFLLAGIRADKEALNYLRVALDDTPNYVQMACFHIVADGAREAGREQVDAAIRAITNQNSYAYHTLLNSLTQVQQRVLRLAAVEGKDVYAKELCSKYEIKSPQHVAQAIKSLVEKQIIDESTKRGVVVFDDPLFRIWLKNEFSG